MVSSEASRGGGGGFGDEQDWPPGFRFHPTDEELVLYYLKRKICRKKLKLNIIAETDVYKWDPEELPGLSVLQTGDRQWFFFNPRDRKYPNGARSNRATRNGYWKVTGKDRIITCNSRSVGVKKTLVFYRGRAPNGERTDWVMHEYTLEEEELKRCQNVQEYYALYKVYKKSGPGPKNGEQYGAPFREEDWNYDFPDFDNSANQDVPVEKVDEGLKNDNVGVNSQVPSFTVEELMKDLTEYSLPDLSELNGYTNTPSQVVSKEDLKSTLVDLPYKEVIVQVPVNQFCVNGVQRNLQASFDLLPPAVAELQVHQAPVVESDPSIHEREVFILPEEGFLEMDDLLCTEPDQINVEESLNNFQVDETDGIGELDLYHDAAMFLNDIGPGPDPVIDQYGYYFGSNPLGPGEVVDQPYVDGEGPSDNQLFLNDANQINYHLYLDDAPPALEQEGSVLTSAEFYPGSNPDQTSGVVFGSSNFSLQANQNQSGNDVNGATSWLSSAIWSFVESIPTTPASAAENALVNRAFGRMSSFSRIRMNVVNASVSTGSDSETTKCSRRNRGFIFFPVLVVVIAILWVVIGTVRIWGTGITT